MEGTWVALVEEYLLDAGFGEDDYYIIDNDTTIDVDFDDKRAVTYILKDISKTTFSKKFIVSYKKHVYVSRHTASFFPIKI